MSCSITVQVLAVLLTCTLVTTSTAQAQTIWYVDDDAPGDPGPGDPAVSDPLEDGSVAHPFDAIQEGIDAAVDGDKVSLADGVYAGPGNTDLDLQGKEITIRGRSGVAEACIIDGGGFAGGFYLYSGETPATVIADLTIRNCGDGAITCTGSGVTVDDCRLVDNMTGGHSLGGAVYGYNHESVLTDCLISGNSAGYGGGIYTHAGLLTLTRCTISGNRAIFGIGGVFAGTDSVITDCRIEHNLGRGLVAGPGSVITNCRIEHNLASSSAGIEAAEDALIQHCLIRWNRTLDSGGAISGGQYVNCLIAGNVSEHDTAVGTANRLVNCTVVDNTAEEGAALGAERVVNCIVWGNTPEQIESGTEVAYSCVEGGWPGTGNIDDDPQLAFDEDQHLTAGSPCIGAGTNDPPGGLPKVDLDGNPRPLPAGGVADMGAYEFNDAQPTIAVSWRELLHSRPLGSGDPPPPTLGTRNAGGGDLDWELLEECPWLSCDPASGTSAGEVDDITLEVDVSTLPHGEHVCDLVATAPDAVNDPLHITLTLRLTDVLHVPADYTTIQAAVDEAVDGDRIVLGDGVHTGPGNVEIGLLGKDIVIESASGDPGACVIDCDGASYGIEFSALQGPSVVLSGITVKNADGNGVRVGGDASPTITNCRFVNNAGAGLKMGDRSNPIVSRCLFASNGSHGVAVWNRASPTFSHCAIRDNQNSGVYHTDYCVCYGGPRTIRLHNCLLAGNVATRGGGVCVGAVASAAIEVRNCTFHGNVAMVSGGGLAIRGSIASASVRNTIFWGNDAPDGSQLCLDGSGASADLAYCDVQGGLEGIYVSEGAELDWSELIDADPLFVDATGEDDHLTAGSPCIDAADNTAVPPDSADVDDDGDTTERTPLDLDLNPRFVDDPETEDTGVADPPDYPAVVDMGAYEFQALVFGDCDGDGDVDGDDLAILVGCMSGPDVSYPADCDAADLDLDGDVDLHDFARFQQAFMGP